MAKNQDEEARTDETLEETGSDPRVYELGFHLDPELPTEEVKKGVSGDTHIYRRNGYDSCRG